MITYCIKNAGRTSRPNGSALASLVRPAMFLGCTRAMELILSRVWPARRGCCPTSDHQIGRNLAAAVGAIVQAVATGRLTPDEGHALGGLVDYQRRSLELVEIEARLAALEAQSRG